MVQSLPCIYRYGLTVGYQNVLSRLCILAVCTVYPKKYAHGSCFAVLCCGYTLTDFPISIRLTSLALWQSNDCPSASKATLMNMDKYFMWIHYERLHDHNKAKHNKTVCIFLGIYCISSYQSPSPVQGAVTITITLHIFLTSNHHTCQNVHFGSLHTIPRFNYKAFSGLGSCGVSHSQMAIFIPFAQRSCRGYIGYTPSVCPFVRPASPVRSVAPTVLDGSIPSLYILSSNFRMCVACKVSCKIWNFEFLTFFFNL